MDTKLNRGILLLLTPVFDGPVTVNQQVGTPTYVPVDDPGNDVLATFDDLSRNILDSLVAVLLGERPGIESPFLANNYAIIRIFDSMDGDSRTIIASRRAPKSHRGSAHLLPDEVDQIAGFNSRARFAPPARGSVRTGCHRENPRSPLEQKSS